MQTNETNSNTEVWIIFNQFLSINLYRPSKEDAIFTFLDIETAFENTKEAGAALYLPKYNAYLNFDEYNRNKKIALIPCVNTTSTTTNA